RLAELGEVIRVGRHARAWLRRDGARFPALAALAETLPPAAEVEAALDCTLDERGQVRDDASPALAAARAVVRELRVQLEARSGPRRPLRMRTAAPGRSSGPTTSRSPPRATLSS